MHTEILSASSKLFRSTSQVSALDGADWPLVNAAVAKQITLLIIEMRQCHLRVCKLVTKHCARLVEDTPCAPLGQIRFVAKGCRTGDSTSCIKWRSLALKSAPSDRQFLRFVMQTALCKRWRMWTASFLQY